MRLMLEARSVFDDSASTTETFARFRKSRNAKLFANICPVMVCPAHSRVSRAVKPLASNFLIALSVKSRVFKLVQPDR